MIHYLQYPCKLNAELQSRILYLPYSNEDILFAGTQTLISKS